MKAFIKTKGDNIILAALFILAAVKVILHMVFYEKFAFFGDEYLFIACGRRLSFGYMDHPPIVPLIARILMLLNCPPLFAFRLIPALIGGATLFFVGIFTRIIGGTVRAVCFAALFYLATPVLLRVHTKLSIAVFEQFALILFFCILAVIIKCKKTKMLIGLFLVAACAFLIKYSLVFWLVSFLLCVLLIKDYRFVMKNTYFYLGTVVFFGLIAPNIWWQIRFGFPIFELFKSIKLLTAGALTYLSFIAGQIIYLHPVVFLISLLGFVYFSNPKSRGYCYRIFAYMSLGVFVFLFSQKAKVYYTTALFLPLMAGGSVYLDRLITSKKKTFITYLLLIFLFLTSVPFALPFWSLSDVLARYDKILPFRDMKYDYLNRESWEKLVISVEDVYAQLNPREQKDAYIFCAYATSAAVLQYHLESKIKNSVISSHNDFYRWYNGKCTGKVVIAVGWPYAQLMQIFKEVEIVKQAESRHFNQPSLYLCRDIKYSFNEVFKSLKH